MAGTDFDLDTDVVKPLVFFLGMHSLLPDLPEVKKDSGFFDDEPFQAGSQNQYINNFNQRFMGEERGQTT